ncbi:hypothetical protein ACI2JA_06375 [Alkalihalobacillus sp. NPDC078783]
MDLIVPICLAVILVSSVSVVALMLSKRDLPLITKFIPIFIMEFAAMGFIYYGFIVQEDITNPYAILGFSMIFLAVIPLMIILLPHSKNMNKKGRGFN